MDHYCHNCRFWSYRPDGAHCAWCLRFFYANGRMPLKTDHEQTVIESLYARLSSLT
jgi:hypothetical protein